MDTSRKTINVVAALIRDGKRVFTTARGQGNYKGWWEFPGGKVEPGESPEDALVREIREVFIESEIEKQKEIADSLPDDHNKDWSALDRLFLEMLGD